jgi:GT2 family glycosyltransferase
MDESPVDVSIIIVNFNGGETVLDCLRSVRVQTRDIAYEVLVVDNGSTDGSPARIRSAFSEVDLLRNPDNKGFSRACNQGLRKSRGRLLLLLNSDTLLPGNAVKEMAEFIQEHPGAGIAGCMLLNEDGTYQKSSGKIRDIVNEWRERRIRAGLEQGTRAAWRREERFARHVRSVDWVSGAFLMIRRTVTDRIGLLNERMFLFFEDIDWCARARQAGWRVLYNPHVRVIHLGGRSVDNNRIQSRLEYRRSQLLFYKAHHGAGPDTRLLRLYLLARALHGFMVAGLPMGILSQRSGEDQIRNRRMSRELLRLALRD